MIEKIKWDKTWGDTWEITCDDCGEFEEVEGDFQDCLNFLKEEKWRTTKDEGDWVHYCPDCQNKKE